MPQMLLRPSRPLANRLSRLFKYNNQQLDRPASSTTTVASKRGRDPTRSRPLAAVALGSPRAPSSMMESPRPASTRVTPEHTVTSPGNITSPPTHASSALHYSSVKQKNAFSHVLFCCSHSLDGGRHCLRTYHDPEVCPTAVRCSRDPVGPSPIDQSLV